MSLSLVLLLLYCALQVALGLWVGRRVRDSADFLVAGRTLGPGLLCATLLAANIGAGSTVGATGLAYRDGLAAWWWVGSAAIGSAVLALWVGPAMRRQAARHDLRTVGDYLQHRYGGSVRATVALLLWLGALAILAGQLIALAWVLSVVAGTPKALGCLIGGVVITAYFTAGGLHTSARVNVLQLAVKLVGFAIVLPLAVRGAGGLLALASVEPTNAAYWNPWQSGGSGLLFLASLGPAFVVSPGLLQKVYGARSDSAVRWGVGTNALALFAYAAVPVLLGLVARARFPGLSASELALPTLLMEGVPPVVGGLGLAAVVSAEVSAADAVLFMLATSLSRDLYRQVLDPAATEGRMLRVARAAGVFSGLLGVGVAIAAPGVIAALSVFYTLLSVSLFVPVLAGLALPRAGAPEALCSIAAGVGVTLVVQAGTFAGVTGAWPPSVAGLGAAVVGFLLALVARRVRGRP